MLKIYTPYLLGLVLYLYSKFSLVVNEDFYPGHCDTLVKRFLHLAVNTFTALALATVCTISIALHDIAGTVIVD